MVSLQNRAISYAMSNASLPAAYANRDERPDSGGTFGAASARIGSTRMGEFRVGTARNLCRPLPSSQQRLQGNLSVRTLFTGASHRRRTATQATVRGCGGYTVW